ncbi:type I polyketide synthase [Microbulbifer sp. ANSA003]|uniref:type I polyketide synthase n=1 Tax=Microbulbifer sp. ANSA003 TaxID=3243360 RepID=UPI0040416D6C
MSDNENKIAIIGWAGRFPQSATVAEFIEKSLSGETQIAHFDPECLKQRGINPEDPELAGLVANYGYLDKMYHFDAEFFAMQPAEAGMMDPQQRMLLELSYQALCDAGYPMRSDLSSCGVYMGTGVSQHWLSETYQAGARGVAPDAMRMLLGNGQDFVSTNISYRLNLGGPSVSLNTACSTSLVAVHQACSALLNYECDMAISGGVNASIHQERGYFTIEGGIESPDGCCRPFDEKANGTVPGNGGAVVVLKRLEDALEDQDPIYAVIRGSAINNDGSDKIGFTAPSVSGQRNVIEAAMAMAEVEADDIGYIEAHGTGTHLGDPIEFQGLKEAFSEASPEARCGVSSVKANIGHLNAAAGVAGLIRASACIDRNLLPKTANYQSLNPAIDLAQTPFFISSELQAWPQPGQPRIAGVSSFGIGGSNAHVLVEQAPAQELPGAREQAGICVLSAHSPQSLAQMKTALAEFVAAEDKLNLNDLAYTLQERRDEFSYRHAFAYSSRQSLLEQLNAGDTANGKAAEADPRLAFVFSGQGSQVVNMLKGLYQQKTAFSRCIDESAAYIQPLIGRDIRELIYPDGKTVTEEEAQALLAQTRYAQPALFMVQYALAVNLIEHGIKPSVMLGHSLGEYVAACLSQVMSWQTALTLVCARAEAMFEQPPGSMLSVAAGIGECEGLLLPGISVAAINSKNNITLAGTGEAIAQQGEALTDAGLQWRLLETSHAFHSPLIRGARDLLHSRFTTASLQPGTLAYVSNITGELATDQQAVSGEYWLDHMEQAVQFAPGVETLAGHSDLILDLSPGSTLTGLLQGQQKPVVALAGKNNTSVTVTLQAMAAKLWQAGCQIDWQQFRPETGKAIHLPPYAFCGAEYLLPQAQGAKSAAQTDKPVEAGQVCYRTVYQPSYLAKAGLAYGSILIFADEVTPLLSELAIKHGAKIITSKMIDDVPDNQQWQFDWAGQDWADQEALFELSREVQTVLVQQPTDLEADDFMVWQLRLLNNLLLLNRRQTTITANLILSRQSTAVMAECEISPPAAMSLGFWRCAQQENSQLNIKLVDIHADETSPVNATVGLLASELCQGENELAVIWRAGQRWVQKVEPLAVQQGGASRLKQGGVYIVTGARGKVGSLLCRYLSETYQAKVVLVVREGIQAPDWSWLQASLDQEQALVAPLALDDSSAWDTLLQQLVSKWGGIDGVFHAATTGAKSFSLLSEMTPGHWQGEFQAKVSCLQVMADAFESYAPDFILTMSSIASLLGGLGHGAYSAANCYLDHFVLRQQQKHGQESPWLTVNWDGWQTGLELQGSDKEQAFSDADGLGQLERVLADNTRAHRVVAACAPLTERIDKWVKLNSLQQQSGDLQAGNLLERLRGIWHNLFGVIPENDSLGFFSCGGDSMHALLLVKALQTEFGYELPLQELIANDFSIGQLAQMITESEQDNAGEAWQPVVKMSQQSHEQKMVFIHSGGGGLLCYQELVTALEGRYECYGYRSAIEANSPQPAYEDLKQLAATYVEQIVATVPNGPYNLAGYSLGGIIAFEVALQLEQRGARVDKLVLFDPRPPYRDMAEQLENQMGQSGLFETLYLALCEEFGLPALDVLLPDDDTVTVEQRIEACLVKYPDAQPQWLSWSREYFRHNIAQMYARNDYRPQAQFAGEMSLLRIDDADYHTDRNDIRDLGWREHCQQDVEVFYVSGSHRSLFKPTHIAMTTEVFLTALGLSIS